MSAMNSSHNLKSTHPVLYTAAWILGGFAILIASAAAALGILVLSQGQAGSQVSSFLTWLFAADHQQVTWYITRAAGFTAYLLLWLSTVWGLAVPSRILDGILHGSFTFDFHQFISLLAIGFLGLHIASLLFDQYAPFSLVQVLFPFVSNYRPIWVGLGVIAMYMVVLVTVTFYIRDRIGMKAFRSIHVLSLVGFLGAAVHGLFSGTDSPLAAVQIMYAFTFLSVVFLTSYWLIGQVSKKRRLAARGRLPQQPQQPQPAQVERSSSRRTIS